MLLNNPTNPAKAPAAVNRVTKWIDKGLLVFSASFPALWNQYCSLPSAPAGSSSHDRIAASHGENTFRTDSLYSMPFASLTGISGKASHQQ